MTIATVVEADTKQTVEEFCEERGVVKELEIVRRITEASFGAQALKFSRDVDAESGEPGITIRVATKGKSQEQALESYLQVIDDLVREIPSDARRLFCVSLDFES
jgi:hypothetical protein